MAKNDAYWDKENVKIENVKFTFWDGKDQDVIAKGFADGQYSKARIFPTSSTYENMQLTLKITFTLMNQVRVLQLSA